MALLIEQKLVDAGVMGEDKWPEDLAEEAMAAERLPHMAEVKNWVIQPGTARMMILLSTELLLPAMYLEIRTVQILWVKLVTAYKSKLKWYIFQLEKELLGVRLENRDDIDTYSLWIHQMVQDYTLSREPSTSLTDLTRNLVKMTNNEHMLYLRHSVSRNEDWVFFLELIIDQKCNSYSHARWNCDDVRWEEVHNQVWGSLWTESPAVRKRKCERQWRR